jgi:NAD(P)-dependent dehydrogenase (short-subunit alcohol dehydrogenase family)
LEILSPSYLASKAALVFLIEGFDKLHSIDGIRFTAVAPGAFPSRMQGIVAESVHGSVVAERRNAAIKTLNTETDPTKLIEMINFLIKNPELAGGRLWSANFDQLTEELISSDFGKLRRIY